MRLRRVIKEERKNRKALVAWRLANMQEEVDDYGLQEVRRETSGNARELREGGRVVEGRQECK